MGRIESDMEPDNEDDVKDDAAYGVYKSHYRNDEDLDDGADDGVGVGIGEPYLNEPHPNKPLKQHSQHSQPPPVEEPVFRVGLKNNGTRANEKLHKKGDSSKYPPPPPLPPHPRQGAITKQLLRPRQWMWTTGMGSCQRGMRRLRGGKGGGR